MLLFSRTMLDIRRVQAITVDLDDTLWPIWPTIARAETVLHGWLSRHAPATAALYTDRHALRAIREQMERLRPELAHDLSAMRRESIRLALQRAGDNPALAEPAFEVFFAERQRVAFFEDALPALERLAARYPLVAVSNGNADIHRVGLGHCFRGAVSAIGCGASKPDARIFLAGAQAAGVAPEAVLHVGDDIALDVVGALDAGLQAVWVNRDERPWAHERSARPHAVVAELGALCTLLGLP